MKMKTFPIIAQLVTVALALSFTQIASAAKVFQWTDDNGQIHYSQFPPSDAAKKAEAVNVKAPKANNPEAAAENLNKLREGLKQNIDGREKKSEEQIVAEKNKKIRADNCVLAKDQLRELQSSGRIYKTLENGERHWYDEKEREGLVQQAKDQMKEYCD